MLRPPKPKVLADTASALGRSPLEVEIVAEQAASLGRAGAVAESRLALLRETERDSPDRPLLLRAAAEAVYAYFIQRELCGFRRHDDVIRHLEIPLEVLARLGAM